MLNEINASSTFDQNESQRSAASLLAQALAGSVAGVGAQAVKVEFFGDQVSISPEARRLLEEIRERQDNERNLIEQDAASNGNYEDSYRKLGNRNRILHQYNTPMSLLGTGQENGTFA